MAGNAGGFENDPLAPGSYSQLLFGDDIPGLETDGCFGFTSSFSPNDNGNNNNNNISTPKMLGFGDYAKQCKVKVAVKNAEITGRKPGPACKGDSSLPFSNKKRNRSGTNEYGSDTGAPTGNKTNVNKIKPDSSTVIGHAKVVKKEKLGKRITALQQLVSPFGKTDTSSVLHEAFGYIRFLHDQVQVLCSPYLQRRSASSSSSDEEEEPRHPEGEVKLESERRKNGDLRSRGLCLVPLELTPHVADSNGADLWSPAAVADTVATR
ncbi:hypothetical protein OROHE_024483 [Orobanche hederae]